MIVGVPKEIKPDEYRVGLLPVGAEELTPEPAISVLVEAGAGSAPDWPIEEYVTPRGRDWSPVPQEIYGRADMIVKVKEPQPAEVALLRRGPDRLHLFPLGRRPAS